MELVDVDTQHAYERIRHAIITLELPPGALVNEQRLAEKLAMGAVPIREALKLLAHDELIVITRRHGLYVTDINIADLKQISEVRLTLEPECAGLAAQRATADDLAVLEALRQEQSGAASDDSQKLLDLDHKFHQAIVAAAKNRHLIRILEHLFGLSQRLWYMALPQSQIVATAVAEHLGLVTAIRGQDVDRARQIMHDHVKSFYAQVLDVLKTESGA